MKCKKVAIRENIMQILINVPDTLPKLVILLLPQAGQHRWKKN
jgi:hypothetical protein